MEILCSSLVYHNDQRRCHNGLDAQSSDKIRCPAPTVSCDDLEPRNGRDYDCGEDVSSRGPSLATSDTQLRALAWSDASRKARLKYRRAHRPPAVEVNVFERQSKNQ